MLSAMVIVYISCFIAAVGQYDSFNFFKKKTVNTNFATGAE